MEYPFQTDRKPARMSDAQVECAVAAAAETRLVQNGTPLLVPRQITLTSGTISHQPNRPDRPSSTTVAVQDNIMVRCPQPAQLYANL